MTSKYGTRFLESEAILAAQENDMVYLREMAGELLPGERRMLSNAAQRLMDMLDDMNYQERLSKGAT